MDGENVEGFNLANPEDLLGGNTNNGVENAPEVQIPETFGEVPRDQFFAGLGAATNGEISDYNKFNELLGYKERFTELEKRANELEAQSQIDPFASDLTKALNEMHKLGASNDELTNFLNLQKLNLDEMSNSDAIVMAKKIAMKGQLSDTELQEWYKETYENVEEGESLTGGQKAKLIEAAQAAKESLSKHKVDSGQPASVRQQQMQQQHFEKRSELWKTVMHQKFAQQETQTISTTIGKDENGQDITLDFDFPVPANVRQEITALAAAFGAQQGFNGNQEQLQKVQEFAQGMLWAKMGPQIYEAGIRNARSKTTEDVNMKHHNVNKIGADTPNKTQKPSTDASKLSAWAKSQKPFG